MNTKLLRSKVLSLAIRGRLVPQDPNDEPAIALLRRINPNFTPQPTDSPLPQGWTACRLGELVNIISGVSYAKGDVTTKGIRILRGGNIQEGAIFTYEDDVFLGKQYANSTNSVNKGDIVMVASTGSFIALGKTGYCIEDMENTQIGAFLRIIRAKDKALASFLNLFFLSDAFRKHIRNKAKGTNINNIKGSYITDYVFPLPPLAEQERIAKEVERWFACIEQLERSREALGKAARQTKRTLLSLAIAGRLVPQDPSDEPAIELLRRINPKFTPQPTDEPLPQGWTACTMSTLCELTDGERIKGKEMINLDAKYLRGQNEGKTLKEGRTIPASSLLILVDGENSGEVFRTPIEGYQGSTFKRLVINDNMYEPFVLHVINSHRKRLRENKVGSAIPHLNKKLFRELTVLVPPLAEQERIVGKVEELFAVLDSLQ